MTNVLDVNHEIADRIRQKMDVLGFNPTDLIRLTGASKGTVSKWLSSTNVPSGKFLAALAVALKVSSDWILTGIEDLTPDTIDLTQFVLVGGDGSEPDPRDYILVPRYDIKAACGNGYLNHEDNMKNGLMFRRDWIKRLGLSVRPEDLGVIYSADLSMWPTIEPDSVLLIDLTDNDPEQLKNGKIYTFLYGQDLRVKRVFIPVSGSQVRLVSDNTDKIQYPDETVTKEDAFSLRFIGRVVWRGGEL